MERYKVCVMNMCGAWWNLHPSDGAVWADAAQRIPLSPYTQSC